MALATELSQAELKQLFEQLATEWHEETGGHSVTSRIVGHPNYLRIIGLGPRAIQLILRDLRENGGWWFAALKALTGEDPSGPGDATRYDELEKAWFHWAEERGFEPSP